MPCTDFTAEQAADFAQEDVGRLQGGIVKSLAVTKPFANVLKGGTWKNNISEVQKVVVQEQAVPADSMVNPEFENTSELCGCDDDEREDVGTSTYEYRLGTKRGEGPLVCVNQGRDTFEGSYLAAEQALKQLVLEYMDADIRYQLYSKSGTKVISADGYDLDDLISGGEGQISVAFSSITPDSQPSFKMLVELCNVLHDLYLAPQNGSGVNAHYKLIGSRKLIQDLRDEIGVRQDLRAIVQGSFKFGNDTLMGYSWEGPFQGLAFGVDQRPLRASGIVNGAPTFIEPYTSQAATKGRKRVLAPAWKAGLYEMCFLMAEGAFTRLVPERYTGEGSFRFVPQLVNGTLEWHYFKDNGRNRWGDFGWHKYAIERTYRPERPHWVIPILYKRCTANLGLAPCESSVNSL